MSEQPLMYTDLAPWWPLLSPPQEYVEEATMIGGLLLSALGRLRDQPTDAEPSTGRPTLLELGSGGGHNAVQLGRHFDLVLVDLAEGMLEVSRALNPGAEHVLGDMRTVCLGRHVDAVLVHDAIDYLLTEDDLSAVFATARAHLDVGGVAVFVPDDVRETFVSSTEHGGTDGEDGRGIRYLSWSWDPDPDDTWVQTEYSYVMRGPDGAVSTAAESHRTGLFSVSTWLDLLQRNGFEAITLQEASLLDGAGVDQGEDGSEDDVPLRTLFVAHAIA